MQRLFGAMSPPSRQKIFEAWWISCLADSRAKTSAWPANAPDLTANDPASFSASWKSPTIAVRNGFFWRTSLQSLLPPPPLWTRPKANSLSAQPPASWGNWPTAGGTRNGLLFQRPAWAPATNEIDGSALRGAMWATPRANDAEKRGRIAFRRAMPELVGQAQNWPTPAARDAKGANSQKHALVTGGGRKHMDQLANFVAHSQYSPQARTTPDGQTSSPSGQTSPLRLNPAFVCWLMGWPQWWTNSGVTSSVQPAMALYRSRCRQHLSRLLGE